ncbi:hypothetical protein OIV83_000320 [Microbotryomycetes sp. JL201]|nr:hypothetical protein OIV83_000320 [Microbotryomycetes sp. JL201]
MYRASQLTSEHDDAERDPDDFGGTKSKNRAQARNTKRYGGASKRRIKWGRGGATAATHGGTDRERGNNERVERGVGEGARRKSNDEKHKDQSSPPQKRLKRAGEPAIFKGTTGQAHGSTDTGDIRMRFSSTSPATKSLFRGPSHKEQFDSVTDGKKRAMSVFLSSDPDFEAGIRFTKRIRNPRAPTLQSFLMVRGQKEKTAPAGQRTYESLLKDQPPRSFTHVFGEKSNMPSHSSPKKLVRREGGSFARHLRQSLASTFPVYRDGSAGASHTSVDDLVRRAMTSSTRLGASSNSSSQASTISLSPPHRLDCDGPSRIEPTGDPDQSSIVVFERDDSERLTTNLSLLAPDSNKTSDANERPVFQVSATHVLERQASASSASFEPLNLRNLELDLPDTAIHRPFSSSITSRGQRDLQEHHNQLDPDDDDLDLLLPQSRAWDSPTSSPERTEDSQLFVRQTERMIGQALRPGSRIDWRDDRLDLNITNSRSRGRGTRMVLIREEDLDQLASDEEDELTLKG